MNEAQQLTLPWPVVGAVIIGAVSFTVFVLTNWWNGERERLTRSRDVFSKAYAAVQEYPSDVMGESNPGNLTLSDPNLLAVWSGDGSERMRRVGNSRARLVLERASDLSGFQQFEVQSFGGNTGTYQIKVRVNNICVMSGSKAIYSYAGGPDGYLWDVPADSNTRDTLRPHPLQNIQIHNLLGDNEDWYWESEPDEDWYKIEGLKDDREYTLAGCGKAIW